MIQFIKNWTLPIAMIVGAIGYKIMGYLSFLSPFLIFTMLLLTFCKVSFKELRITWAHLWLLLIEVGGAVVLFFIVKPVDYIVAQGVMLCMICPTATAAAVVTGKLHGNIASITSYTLLCNIVVAIAVPALFPLLAPTPEQTSFWSAFLMIIKKVFPLLIFPFIVAQCLRKFTPKFHAKLTSISGLAFYLWGVALTLAMGQTVRSIVEQPSDLTTLLLLGVGGLFCCAIQFFLGKIIGNAYGDTIACGQSLGQKNTVLAIWMGDVYLNPLSAVAPGTYVIWQNIFNSWQLWRERKLDAQRDAEEKNLKSSKCMTQKLAKSDSAK